MKPTKILIGIQARSTSTRLPEKCFAPIGNKMLLDYVVDAAEKSSNHMNHRFMQKNVTVKKALLIPVGDDIEKHFKFKSEIVFGPEANVLQRFKTASDKFDADYIVRITGDCPSLPSDVITRHITCAYMNRYDYVANCYPHIRLALDGYDCEVMSKKMIDYIYENATSDYDKEHVTTFCKQDFFRWATYGIILHKSRWSALAKLSVDTEEEYLAVKKKIEHEEEIAKQAYNIFGKSHVHWH